MMLGERLKVLRQNKKLTQKELADRLGIARTTYSGYENETREPDHETLQKIADFHSVSVDSLLGRKIGLTEDKTEKAIKELVRKYNLDLTKEGTKEKLEAIIKLVVEDYNHNN